MPYLNININIKGGELKRWSFKTQHLKIDLLTPKTYVIYRNNVANFGPWFFHSNLHKPPAARQFELSDTVQFIEQMIEEPDR